MRLQCRSAIRVRFGVRRGFSLGEVLLAAFVLTAGILVVVKLISDAYRTSENVQDIIIAAELAQEGVELVRNLRDNNLAYRADHWNTGEDCEHTMSGECDPFKGFPSGANKSCALNDAFDGEPVTLDCSSSSSALNKNGDGFYVQSSTSPAPFYRIIKIWNTGGGDPSARIQSIVTWQDPGNDYNGANSIDNCTPQNHCVYSELVLTAWK